MHAPTTTRTGAALPEPEFITFRYTGDTGKHAAMLDPEKPFEAFAEKARSKLRKTQLSLAS